MAPDTGEIGLLKSMETSTMKRNEPSALVIARQRAAHQVLDHGSVLHDRFAIKILRDDEKDMLQFANAHPLAGIGHLFTAARSPIAEDALSGAAERGIRHTRIVVQPDGGGCRMLPRFGGQIGNVGYYE